MKTTFASLLFFTALAAAAPASTATAHDELAPRDLPKLTMSVQVHESYVDEVGYSTTIMFYDALGKEFSPPPFVDDWMSLSLFQETGVPIGGGYSMDMTAGPGVRVYSGNGCVDQTCVPKVDNSTHPGDSPSVTWWLCKFPNPNKC